MIGINKTTAILSLVPNAEFVTREDVVEWINPSVAPVSDEQISQELSRLQQKYEADEYKRKRQAEYPSFADYLDGVVKGDQEQINKYIADCLAVKAKYPKETAI
jgi:hypothetical protein